MPAFRSEIICRRCGLTPDKTEFTRWKHLCRRCAADESLIRFRKLDADPAWHKAKVDKVYASRRNKTDRYLLNAAKYRAKKLGLDFSITVDDVKVPVACPVLGILLAVCSKQSANSPTIDRFDNSIGYVPGNVHVISWRANSLKNNATIDELEKVLAYMKSKLGKSAQ